MSCSRSSPTARAPRRVWRRRWRRSTAAAAAATRTGPARRRSRKPSGARRRCSVTPQNAAATLRHRATSGAAGARAVPGCRSLPRNATPRWGRCQGRACPGGPPLTSASCCAVPLTATLPRAVAAGASPSGAWMRTLLMMRRAAPSAWLRPTATARPAPACRDGPLPPPPPPSTHRRARCGMGPSLHSNSQECRRAACCRAPAAAHALLGRPLACPCCPWGAAPNAGAVPDGRRHARRGPAGAPDEDRGAWGVESGRRACMWGWPGCSRPAGRRLRQRAAMLSQPPATRAHVSRRWSTSCATSTSAWTLARWAGMVACPEQGSTHSAGRRPRVLPARRTAADGGVIGGTRLTHALLLAHALRSTSPLSAEPTAPGRARCCRRCSAAWASRRRTPAAPAASRRCGREGSRQCSVAARAERGVCARVLQLTRWCCCFCHPPALQLIRTGTDEAIIRVTGGAWSLACWIAGPAAACEPCAAGCRAVTAIAASDDAAHAAAKQAPCSLACLPQPCPSTSARLPDPCH